MQKDMNQKKLIEIAIERVGGKSILASKINVAPARITEWLKGKSIRYEKMVEILGVVGLGLKIYELAEFGSQFFKASDVVMTIKKEKKDCDCFLDGNGLLRRGKIRCIKSKSEHKF
jgi:hypothetical protein